MSRGSTTSLSKRLSGLERPRRRRIKILAVTWETQKKQTKKKKKKTNYLQVLRHRLNERPEPEQKTQRRKTE